MCICNSDICWQNNPHKGLSIYTNNLWTLIYWQPHYRDGTPVIHIVFCISLSMNEAEEYSLFKSHLYFLFCEVPLPILCPFCYCLLLISSISRSALYLGDLHFDFNINIKIHKYFPFVFWLLQWLLHSKIIFTSMQFTLSFHNSERTSWLQNNF